ncbi:sensor histidine kinase [Hymenobacter cavernae]|uniref:histidine kinase n=1 Tax=Hymenobacter cavernae TaxID=2044852 RepID=A0ABQ1UX24_9BACT|nr:ATP-binding protein [Hymenobacter cavernae]GGF27668.1 PAS domain-containing sensor histidine kinase [Hymenobacter cavernae]
MYLKLHTKIILGFTISLSILLLTSLAAYFSIQQLAYSTRLVEHTYKVLQYTSDLRMQMRDAQSSLRGYLLVSDSAYLKSSNTYLPIVLADYDSLRRLTVDNPAQLMRLDTLRQIISEEKEFLDLWRGAAPSPEAAQALLLSDRNMLERLRLIINRIKDTEEELLKHRTARQDFFEKTTPLAILVSAALAIITVLWLFRKIWQELNANARLQAELAQVNTETSRRIQIIENLAEKVVQGDYKVRIRDKEKDNLGNLATSLNRMTQTLDTAFSALENRNKELDQFAYVASHDLKAPLRGVLTVLKWIEDELSHELSTQMWQYLGMMKGRLARLEDLINGILAYARIGRTEQKLESVRVQELVQEVVDLVVPAEFTVHIAPDLPTFVTDRLSLEQVFTNLLSNAVKYHGSAIGTITISCSETKKLYEFRVADDGPGIAPEYHEKIFLIFQTLRDRNTAESTGIGLSIVKKIIEERKGSIRVESAPGEGATFIFTWPKE